MWGGPSALRLWASVARVAIPSGSGVQPRFARTAGKPRARAKPLPESDNPAIMETYMHKTRR